jgi:hypothetical protein
MLQASASALAGLCQARRHQEALMSEILDALKLPEQYRESRAHLFASDLSLDWFIRKNRKQLVEVGALLVVAGRKYVNSEKLDAVVVEVATAAARRLTGHLPTSIAPTEVSAKTSPRADNAAKVGAADC